MLKIGDKVDFQCPRAGIWEFLGEITHIETEESDPGRKPKVYRVEGSEYWYGEEQLRKSKQ